MVLYLQEKKRGGGFKMPLLVLWCCTCTKRMRRRGGLRCPSLVLRFCTCKKRRRMKGAAMPLPCFPATGDKWPGGWAMCPVNFLRFCWWIWWTSATFRSLLQILHRFLICDSYWIHSSFHNSTDLLQRLICSCFYGEPISGYTVLNVSLLHTATFWLFPWSICFCKLLVTTLDISAYYHIIKISISWDSCLSSSQKNISLTGETTIRIKNFFRLSVFTKRKSLDQIFLQAK